MPGPQIFALKFVGGPLNGVTEGPAGANKSPVQNDIPNVYQTQERQILASKTLNEYLISGAIGSSLVQQTRKVTAIKFEGQQFLPIDGTIINYTVTMQNFIGSGPGALGITGESRACGKPEIQRVQLIGHDFTCEPHQMCFMDGPLKGKVESF